LYFAYASRNGTDRGTINTPVSRATTT